MVDKRLEVFKPAPVHFCTDFTLTASATVSTYCRDIFRGGTLLRAVRVMHDSYLRNNHPYPQPTLATLPDRHPLAGKFMKLFHFDISSSSGFNCGDTRNESKSHNIFIFGNVLFHHSTEVSEVVDLKVIESYVFIVLATIKPDRADILKVE
ncbi:hypothetical protein RF11_01861 [Thelohanellus kitauei]|uniref:Uncharacterized protein n=1 Tax=Thelohanellus kitauei TaxID=669202 RepID=A0A0C2MND3_THEKT|nr:hypothetical protein RF11_01861 [Thelohanellus kitauei]